MSEKTITRFINTGEFKLTAMKDHKQVWSRTSTSRDATEFKKWLHKNHIDFDNVITENILKEVR